MHFSLSFRVALTGHRSKVPRQEPLDAENDSAVVPSVLCDRAGDLPNADEIINSYKDDLPSPELFRQELLRFQIRWNIVNFID